MFTRLKFPSSSRCLSVCCKRKHSNQFQTTGDLINDKHKNSKLKWTDEKWIDTHNNHLRSRAMIRNLTIRRPVSCLVLCSHLNTMTTNVIQSKMYTNLTKGDKKSKDTIIEKKAKESKEYGILSKQTTDQISSILTQAQSTPNMITIMRICSTPFLSYLIMKEQYTCALVGCCLAGLSDGLDGYIARNYDGKTVLGSYLDPLADKLFINCVALSLSSVDILPIWCVGIWIGKDIILCAGTYRNVALATKGSGHALIDPSRTPLKIEPTFISQINTLLQFGTIWVGLGVASVDIPYDDLVHGLSWISCVTTFASCMSYLDGKSMKKSGNPDDKKSNNTDK